MEKSIRILWKSTFIAIAAFMLFLLLCTLGLFGDMPTISDIQNPSASQSSQVYAQDGTLLGKYYLQDRVNVEYKDIAKPIVDALVATEDERYFDHTGIDVRSPLAAKIAGAKAAKYGYVIKNDSKVSQRPIDMPNQGFLPSNKK